MSIEDYLTNHLREEEGLHFEFDDDESHIEKLATKVFPNNFDQGLTSFEDGL